MSAEFQKMLDTAVAFFLAGDRCEREMAFDNYPPHWTPAPAVVNFSLALEIGLKALQFLTVGRVFGHNLRELFEALPKETQAKLVFVPQVYSHSEMPFVDWRYPYEHDLLCISTDNLRRAFLQVHDEIRRAHPNFPSFYERKLGIALQ